MDAPEVELVKWGAPTIADFGRHAGFAGAELHTATAIALAASGGVDHYELVAGVPGAGHWVGLYGVNVDEWPDYTPDELRAPQRAADVAHELTRRVGSFGWSSHWRAGADRRWLNAAATAASVAPYHETERIPIAANLYDHHVRQVRSRLASRS